MFALAALCSRRPMPPQSRRPFAPLRKSRFRASRFWRRQLRRRSARRRSLPLAGLPLPSQSSALRERRSPRCPGRRARSGMPRLSDGALGLCAAKAGGRPQAGPRLSHLRQAWTFGAVEKSPRSRLATTMAWRSRVVECFRDALPAALTFTPSTEANSSSSRVSLLPSSTTEAPKPNP